MSDTKSQIFNDLISVSLNIDNLKKYVEINESGHKKQNDEINDIKIKLSNMDKMDSVISELGTKLESLIIKVDDIANTIQWHSSKFIEVEIKSNQINEKFKSLDKYDKGYEESKIKIKKFEDEITKLTRSYEQNINDLQHLKLKTDKLRMDDEIPLYATNEVVNQTKHSILGELESQIYQLKMETFKRMEEIALKNQELLEDNEEDSEEPLEQVEEKINTQEEQIKTDTKSPQIEPQNINQNIITITPENNENNKIPMSGQSKELFNNLIIINQHQDINSNIQQQQQQNDSNNGTIDLDKDESFDEFSTANMRHISPKKSSPMKLTNRESIYPMRKDSSPVKLGMLKDFKKSSSIALRKEFELLKKDVQNIKSQNDAKLEDLKKELKSLISNHTKKKSIDLSNPIHDNEEVHLKSTKTNKLPIANANMQNIPTDKKEMAIKEQQFQHLILAVKSHDEKIKTLDNKFENILQKHSDLTPEKTAVINVFSQTEDSPLYKDLQKALKMINNLNNSNNSNLMDAKEMAEHKEIMNDLKGQVAVIKSKEEEHSLISNSTSRRVYDLEKLMLKVRSMIEDTSEMPENEKLANQNPNAPGNIRELIKATNINLKLMTDRVDKIQNKLDHILNEIVSKLKKELLSKNDLILVESQKVLEEFKVDLKIAILKLDDQLKSKVDKYNFEEFGKKIDFKIQNESSKKIDKNELKKNNNQLNKKVNKLFYFLD
jgi:hypothetical protein